MTPRVLILVSRWLVVSVTLWPLNPEKVNRYPLNGRIMGFTAGRDEGEEGKIFYPYRDLNCRSSSAWLVFENVHLYTKLLSVFSRRVACLYP